jgi:ATP-dependent helicase/nuclease subunit A
VKPVAPGQPVDQEVRRRVVERIDRGCVVEAGAGTGKTTLLVQRALAILASPGASIESLAIMTFTEKAAGELKVRLREGIEGKIREGGERRGLYSQALEAIDRATVTTIHAFAASLLRERPVEAGVDPRFRVFDALESEILRDEVFDGFWSESLNARDPDLEPALRLGVRGDRIRAVANFVVENRDLEPPPAPPELAASSDFVRRFEGRVGRLERLSGNCRAPGDRGLLQIRSLMAVRDGLEDLDPEGALLRILSEGKVNAKAGNEENWSSPSALAEARSLFVEIAQDREETLANFGGHVASRLARWLRRFATAFDEALQTRGGLDFQGLLLKARDLLRDNREVRAYFQDRYEHLLVDEFQDTDPLQAEIVFFLSEDEPRAADWNGVTPGAGRLFIVGDPKQSIYRFRRADIAVYRTASGILAASPGGGRESITVNFRTVPGIISWVNEVFGGLFGRGDGKSQQPDYTPIRAFRDPIEDRPAVILVPMPPAAAPSARRAEGAREVEAAMIADLLKRAVASKEWMIQGRDGTERPAAYGDCALLFRGLTGLDAFEEAFRARDLPYRVVGGRAFYRRQETRHLQAILRALDNPHDGLSIAAALRSPFFGCSDEDLFLYVSGEGAGGRFDYLRDADLVPAGTPVGDAFRLLRDLHVRRNDRSPSATVADLLERTGALPLVLLRPQGEQRVANLLKTVDLARRHEAMSDAGFGSFVRFLTSMEDEERDESESPTVEEEDDIVRLMTVHQAKGLEFPIVILADAAGRAKGGDGFCVDRRSGTFHFSLAFQDYDLRSGSWGFEAAETAEKARSEEEMCRLLYVAATRARDHLVLPVVPHGGQYASFLGLLREAQALPPDGQPGGTFPGSGPLIHCRVVDSDALQITSPESAPFRISLPSRELPRTDPRVAAERLTWRDDLRRALEVASRGRPIRTASSLEGALFLQDRPAATRPDAASGDLDRRARRRGIGIAVHAILERRPPAGSPPDPDTLGRTVAAAALDAGLARADEVEITRLVRAAYATSLPGRLSRARRFDTEFPFAVTLPDGRSGSVLLEGRIDLLIEEADGLVLVDYKTDKLPKGQDPAGFAKQRAGVYRPQAAAYAAAVEALGAKVRSALLLFLDAGQELEIRVDSDLLALGRQAALTMPPDPA